MNPHETLAHEQYFNYNFCEKYICGTVHSIQRYSHIDRKLKSGKSTAGWSSQYGQSFRQQFRRRFCSNFASADGLTSMPPGKYVFISLASLDPHWTTAHTVLACSANVP